MPGSPTPTLIVPDVHAWRRWLDANEDDDDGVWLVLAKKGTVEPTSLGYDEALDEALCSGWIDGQRKGRDAGTYQVRFTPRRRSSLWSQRNVGHAARLIEDGRMRPRGHAEIDRATSDGRWERAYAGQADAQVPDDLTKALAASPRASKAFDALSSQNRYAVIHRIVTAPSEKSRASRLATLVGMLEAGKTPHPQ